MKNFGSRKAQTQMESVAWKHLLRLGAPTPEGSKIWWSWNPGKSHILEKEGKKFGAGSQQSKSKPLQGGKEAMLVAMGRACLPAPQSLFFFSSLFTCFSLPHTHPPPITAFGAYTKFFFKQRDKKKGREFWESGEDGRHEKFHSFLPFSFCLLCPTSPVSYSLFLSQRKVEIKSR